MDWTIELTPRFAATSLACLALSAAASAQISTDDTLGLPQDFVGPDFTIPSDAGLDTGGALMFSFDEFGVPEGGSATFVQSPGTSDVDVVVSRVTGGEPSNILGVLESNLGESHFFFLNPWGVFFGENSSVDLGGSLHVTTADEVRDAEGNVFSARNPTAEVLVAVPEHFGFLSEEPAGIGVAGRLVVNEGSTIDLVGGAIDIAGALLAAPAGQVRLVSLGGPGSVLDMGGADGLVPDAEARLGAIEIRDGSIVTVSGFEVPETPETLFATPIELALLGLVIVVPADQVGPDDVVLGQSPGGESVALLRAPATGEFSAVGRTLLVRDSDVRARSFGSSSGGILVRMEESVWLERQETDVNVGLLARSESIDVQTFGGFLPGGIFVPASTYPLQATGPGANIRIETGDLVLSGGALVSATTLSEGSGGDISVFADGSVWIQGEGFDPAADPDDPPTPTSLIANSQGLGDAGDIRVETPHLRLEQGGAIIAQTTGDADAGDIEIDVARLEIFDTSQVDSSTSAQSLPDGELGPTLGNGGNVDVRASHSILISGGVDDRNFARLSTLSQERTVGSAGTITVTTPSLVISDGGGIAATTRGAGDGGSLVLDVVKLRLSQGGGLLVNSTGSAVELGGADPGAAGSITIGLPDGEHRTRQVWLSGAQITAFAAQGPAPGEPREGNILIDARDLLVLTGASQVTSSVGQGLGGNIDLGGADLLALNGGSTLLAETDDGTGGAIALAVEGIAPQLARAGPSSLQSADFVENRSGGRISADAGAGTAGTLSSTSPELDLESQLGTLDVSFLDSASQLRRACAARAAGEGGSFRVARQRGLPSSPEDLLVAFDHLGVAPQRASAESSIDPVSRGDALRGLGVAQQEEGRFGESVTTLESALSLAEATGDLEQIASVLGHLGNAHVALSDADQAEAYLTRGLDLAKQAGRPGLASRLENNLGNQRAARQRWREALEAYEGAAARAAEAGEPEAEAIALSNAARAALEAEESERAFPLLERAEVRVAAVEGPVAARLGIHLAKSYERVAASSQGEMRDASLKRAFFHLSRASGAADDPRTRSFARGNLGALYESEGRWREALFLTRRALAEAEMAQASDALYRWHWQEGRLLWAQGDSNAALASLGRAVAVAEATRQESQAQYGSAALRFQRAVAPLYLDYVEALLESSERVEAREASLQLLAEARATMESYKAAELRDYFRDECVADIESRTVDLDRVLRETAPTTAVVYPIALEDRLELLVSLPGGLVRRSVAVGSEALKAAVARYEKALKSASTRRYQAPAEELYTWLVAPYRDLLEKEGIDTLVFVPDARLRTVPMAALHDGEGFLLERFAVAVAPGLSLVDPEGLEASSGRFLLAGLSTGGQGFGPLPQVKAEVASIQALYGGEVLLDEAFRTERFEEQVVSGEPTVVHVASHAVFTGDPSDSFVLTADGRITLEELGAMVAPRRFSEAPLELLVLSACQTAAGDEQAALGLAGAAVRSGARSAMGSLWPIADEAAAEVVTGFYEALGQPGTSKAQALRQAQLALLEDRRFDHPFYWSPYLLISNWL